MNEFEDVAEKCAKTHAVSFDNLYKFSQQQGWTGHPAIRPDQKAFYALFVVIQYGVKPKVWF